MELTPRERLLRCLKRQPTDRVPISSYELCGYDREAWYNREPSYSALMEEIRRKADCIWMHWPLLRELNRSETVSFHRDGDKRLTRTVWHTSQGDFVSQTAVMPNVHTVWQVEPMLKTGEDVQRFLRVERDMPLVDMDSFHRKQALLGERGILSVEFGDALCGAAELMGMEGILTLLLTDRALGKALLDRLHERNMHVLREVIKHGVQDTMFRIYGPEYCTPPYFSPEAFPDLVGVYIAPMCRAIRQAGAFPRIHAHGNVRYVMDEIVSAGAVCVDPLEPPPDGDLPLAEAKALYGDKLVLMGNIEFRELERGSPALIRDRVRQAMEAAKSGGGFILLPTATPINVPLSGQTQKNFVAMLDAGWEWGRYR